MRISLTIPLLKNVYARTHAYTVVPGGPCLGLYTSTGGWELSVAKKKKKMCEFERNTLKRNIWLFVIF